ncbi:MAG: DUF308 domain-containing protein [Blastocatellia bacterium]|jgi:uncharacterized membrane protein HdeD (DUF308 family)|nr:DUF308 domain-containing protein [Blastocatellia bacterium]
MKALDFKNLKWRRSAPIGIVTIALGAFAVFSPFWAGEWTLAILGLAVSASAVFELVRAVMARDVRLAEMRYVQSVVMILVGIIFFYSPGLVIRSVLVIIGLLLIADGVMKAVGAVRGQIDGRWWTLLNAAVHIALGVFILYFRFSLGPPIIGLVIGLWLISLGWEMITGGRDDETGAIAAFAPARRLGLEPNADFDRLAETAFEGEVGRRRIDIGWCVMLGVVFFAVHIGRMDLKLNVLGVVSTAVAVLGDVMFALLLAILILLPARLLFRRITKGFERSAWRRRLSIGESTMAAGDRLMARWLDNRLRFDARLHAMRTSLPTALTKVIQIGLPLAAVIVAINPIWGFSWFFNTENWVSGFWQKITEARVDPWRTKMIDSVVVLKGAGSAADAGLFEVTPEGVAGSTDFTFLVLGDTGEGDASQHSLRDRFLLEGGRDDVKFMVISSDVIYPAGAMKDYEPNFYLPFKGFRKPIYAIPGNHDWFGALDAFNANFLEPDVARASIRARMDWDQIVTATAGHRADALVDEAIRLRQEYRMGTGLQRGPFFELHAPGFSLIAVDTGILKRIDERQRVWLEAALERSRGTSTMVILGHPFYAGGYDQWRTNPDFAAIRELLVKHDVPIVMAGDTHDFEYYRELHASNGVTRPMHHFVNGGGGAYLSIGTALDWPATPPVGDWAFYPSTDAVWTKLERETPNWKRPIWFWLKTAGGWPGSVEGLSGAFDFNRAPFFQSFMEIRVEGSARRIRLILHGVEGPLKWRDLQVGGSTVPPDRGPDDTVEFIVPMDGPP